MLALFSKDSYGQNSSSFDIRVTANVVKTIEITTIRNMDFGQIQPGQQQLYISAVRDPEAGKLMASGNPNASIRLTFNRTWQLTSDRGGEPLVFTYEVAGNTEDQQSTAELLQTDNRGLQFNNDGEYFIWIGGQVEVQNAQPGNYLGEFTVEIEYM